MHCTKRMRGRASDRLQAREKRRDLELGGSEHRDGAIAVGESGGAAGPPRGAGAAARVSAAMGPPAAHSGATAHSTLGAGEAAGGCGACTSDESCNLNGVCTASVCVCDPQWDGAHCGTLALLPADPLGGYRRPGFSGWGGNPWFDSGDKKCERENSPVPHSISLPDREGASSLHKSIHI